ncbi:MAG: hypothetical protein QM572_18220, partial [Nocardioides sp.]|uniref:hypothetical protein n=1 Tax=Nocardioides sp. TaxID=35761 RepID=UPI0039E44243
MRRLSRARLTWARVAAATAAVAAGSITLVGTPGTAPAGAADSSAVEKTATVTRVDVDATGAETTVGSWNVDLKVGQTTNLRGRQVVSVSWSGAHATSGLVSDVNSANAAQQEYPFVLLQCRGVENPGSGQTQVSPETCWTQTPSERLSQVSSTAWPAWRSDADAPAEHRTALVDGPSPRPSACGTASAAERWVRFEGADGTVYQGGPSPDLGCVDAPAESGDSTGLPGNATYGITGTDGRGDASFTVLSEAENASLGCSASVACSLVAVPIVGVSCDPYGMKLAAANRPTASQATRADTACHAADAYPIPSSGTVPKHSDVITSTLAVTGSLWWSESNWNNRITVPLTFAQSGSVCDVVSSEKPQQLYGSINAIELTASWTPKFCTDKGLFPIVHVQAAESAARNLLGAGTSATALTSKPLDEDQATPTVQAPIGLSGFGIAYAITGSDGLPVDDLKLNARLVAKLLSQSYPGNGVVANNYDAIGGNPANITQDPEFRALNPGIKRYDLLEAASTIQILSTDSDLMWALSSWLDHDPEARAFLDGAPDPWGTTVNPSYAGIDLPVDAWPMEDDWLAPTEYANTCYQKSPSPILALIANPTGSINTVVQNLQYGISAVKLRCDNVDPNDVATLALKTEGRQPVTQQFVLGVVPLSSAPRYHLNVAALQVRSSVAMSAQFSSADGRTFVSGDEDGLKAATPLLKPDSAVGTWALDYESLRRSDADAYPGTMPIYADIPTSGLDDSTSDKLARFLCYAATTGQTQGDANGQLPQGYLPLTSANGLGEQQAYTVRASRAVLAQAGEVPALSGDAGDCTTAARAA